MMGARGLAFSTNGIHFDSTAAKVSLLLHSNIAWERQQERERADQPADVGNSLRGRRDRCGLMIDGGWIRVPLHIVHDTHDLDVFQEAKKVLTYCRGDRVKRAVEHWYRQAQGERERSLEHLAWRRCRT